MQSRFIFMLLVPLALAACATQPRIARTQDGKPDLNGIWEAMGSAHWNLEPHNAQGGPVAQLGALGAIPAGLGVVWSLAVEEHYYLLYPPLIAVLLRAGRVGLSTATLLGLCLAMLAWRCWLVWNGASEAHLTMATDTRADAILVGCCMALWRNPRLDPVAAPNRRRDGLLILVCVAVLLSTVAYRGEFFRLTLRYSLQSLAVAPLIYLAVARSQHWQFRWLSAKPLVYLGTISYTVYLSHHVILLLVAKHWPSASWLGATLAAAALTLAVAEAMRRWVERPCARLRKKLHRAREVDGTEPRDANAGVASGGVR